MRQKGQVFTMQYVLNQTKHGEGPVNKTF